MLTRSFQLVLVAVLFASPGFGQANARPDFSGVWTTYRAPGGAAAGGRGARGGAAQAELPYTAEAKRKTSEYQALVQPTGDTPGGYCLGTGMPGSMLGSGGYPMEIIQRPDQITIVYEAHNEIRRVYFGNRILPVADRLPERNGYSTGRWEGNTLIVETAQLTEIVSQRFAHSDQARIVERYSLTEEAGQKVLTAEMTLTDPAFYSKPVSETKRWSIVPNGFLMTYECNEPIWTKRLEELQKTARPPARGQN
jgi:hypothetical protein